MDLNTLENSLENSIIKFTDEIHSKYKEGSTQPVNEDDINELARQTSYVLRDFKTQIISYLKDC